MTNKKNPNYHRKVNITVKPDRASTKVNVVVKKPVPKAPPGTLKKKKEPYPYDLYAKR